MKIVFQAILTLFYSFSVSKRKLLFMEVPFSEFRVLLYINYTILKFILVRFKGNVGKILDLSFFQNWNSTNQNYIFELSEDTLIIVINVSAALMEHEKKILVLVQFLFCIRVCSCNLVVAKSFRIHDTPNIIVEARAIMESLKYSIEYEI